MGLVLRCVCGVLSCVLWSVCFCVCLCPSCGFTVKKKNLLRKTKKREPVIFLFLLCSRKPSLCLVRGKQRQHKHHTCVASAPPRPAAGGREEVGHVHQPAVRLVPPVQPTPPRFLPSPPDTLPSCSHEVFRGKISSCRNGAADTRVAQKVYI